MPNIEKNNTTRNYHDQVIINNELKLRELQKKLPWFCKDFFNQISEFLVRMETNVAWS